MKIRIQTIKQMAMARPEGYYEDVISHGIVDGEFLEITPEGYNKLLQKYRPKNRPVKQGPAMPRATTTSSIARLYDESDLQPSSSHMRGLGDLVYKVANPIAHVIDKVTGTHIQGCGGCAKRREKWNQAVPFKQ